MAACSVLIASNLAQLFAALEAKIAVQFRAGAIETIMSDFENDQVSVKHYLLYEEHNLFTAWRLEAFVREYEPETLNLLITGYKTKQRAFCEVIDMWSESTISDRRDWL